MFTALIVACALDFGQCTAFQDTYGPYRTEAECIRRLEQMRPQIEYMLRQHGLPGPYRLDRYCTKSGEDT